MERPLCLDGKLHSYSAGTVCCPSRKTAPKNASKQRWKHLVRDDVEIGGFHGSVFPQVGMYSEYGTCDNPGITYCGYNLWLVVACKNWRLCRRQNPDCRGPSGQLGSKHAYHHERGECCDLRRELGLGKHQQRGLESQCSRA